MFELTTRPAVRLAWRGVPIVNLPAPVRYLTAGEGGVSHFRYGRDNLLLTWMHTRLMFAAAGRLPERVRPAVLGLFAGFGFGVVEVAVRLINGMTPSALLTNPAVYGLLLGGGTAFLLLTSALQRGSVTAATAGAVRARCRSASRTA